MEKLKICLWGSRLILPCVTVRRALGCSCSFAAPFPPTFPHQFQERLNAFLGGNAAVSFTLIYTIKSHFTAARHGLLCVPKAEEKPFFIIIMIRWLEKFAPN